MIIIVTMMIILIVTATLGEYFTLNILFQGRGSYIAT